ncbi:MAG TPA: hypothetical protein VLW88_00935 [Hyphomicrobium sp.]|jgi:hypothetical protein|nr:hypothetical protein [Hyphomicrobium sp.]
MKLKLALAALAALLVSGTLASQGAFADDTTKTDTGDGTGGGSGQTTGDDGTGGGSGQK